MTIATPNFGSSRRQSRIREMRQVRVEVEELRRERCRLKEEIEKLQNERNTTVQAVEPLSDVYAVPPPPPVPTVTRKAITRTIK